MAKKEERRFKQFRFEGHTFYKYKKPKYLYHVDIFKYTIGEGGAFRMELVNSGEFEADKFIGLSLVRRTITDDPNVTFSKDVSLLAAPDEFIQKNNIKQLLENEN